MDSGPIEILCTGDLHLGRHPTRIPSRLDGRSKSPRAVWQDVVREAITRDVDAVVLPGDVADRENRYFEAYGAFEAGVVELDDAGIPILTVAGNHDSEFLPRMVDDIDSENLHLLGDGQTWERWTLEADGEAIAHFDGWSFDNPHVPVSPLDSYDLQAADDVPQIGVLHADLDATESQYAPVASGELESTPAACWLLGHIHTPGIRGDASPTVLYTGSMQALDPGEPGTHGPWIVSVSSTGDVDVEQRPLGTVHYTDLDVDVADAEDVRAVGAAVTDAVRAYLTDLDTSNLELLLPRVHLTGRTAAHAAIADELDSLRDQLTFRQGSVDVQAESIVVDTRPAVDLRGLASGEGPVAYLADLLLALDEGSQEYSRVVDDASDAMQQAHSADAYSLLRREGETEPPARDDARRTLEQEARLLLDTLLQQKDTHS